MPTERWIYRRNGEAFRIDGDIRLDPHFDGMFKPTGEARLMFDGMIVYAQKQKAHHSESAQCGHGCKHANPETECVCICRGENHGIKNISNVAVAGAETF